MYEHVADANLLVKKQHVQTFMHHLCTIGDGMLLN